MGREIKRVPLNFDWPMYWIWPGYMGGVCSDDIEYCVKGKNPENKKSCDICRHAAKLAGVVIHSYGCPEWKIGPPKGDGWQMWETTTEGSPISPVFSTPEELAHWLANNKASACGSQTASYESWLAMIKKGWAPTMALDSEGLKSGVEFIAQEKEKP